jgi:hypothetical protein
MSYCRFENTLADMRDCLSDMAEAAESGLSFNQFLEKLSSDSERRAVCDLADTLLFMTETLEQFDENEGLSEEELEGLDN